MTDLSSLISRVEKATGPDRELDARIWAYFAGVKYVSHNAPYGDVHGRTQVEYTVPPMRTRVVTNLPRTPHAEPVTTSVDAAISLAERVLPGWGWGITHGSEKAEDVQGNVFPKAIPFPAHLDCYGYHAIPAIALVLATLRALQSKGPEA